MFKYKITHQLKLFSKCYRLHKNKVSKLEDNQQKIQVFYFSTK